MGKFVPLQQQKKQQIHVVKSLENVVRRFLTVKHGGSWNTLHIWTVFAIYHVIPAAWTARPADFFFLALSLRLFKEQTAPRQSPLALIFTNTHVASIRIFNLFVVYLFAALLLQLPHWWPRHCSFKVRKFNPLSFFLEGNDIILRNH